MKLRLATIVERVEDILRGRILPLLDDDFAKNEIHLSASLLSMTRMAREDEVALKVDELDKLRDIFAQAAGVVEDAALSERLRTAAGSALPGLTISALDAETGRLRALLVDLHAHVEEMAGDDARRIDREIWRLMRDVEAKRAPRA